MFVGKFLFWNFISLSFSLIYQILLSDSLGFGMFYLREIGKYFIEKYFFYRKKKIVLLCQQFRGFMDII